MSTLPSVATFSLSARREEREMWIGCREWLVRTDSDGSQGLLVAPLALLGAFSIRRW
jgi:MYXO-CTERM domain-containing protein